MKKMKKNGEMKQDEGRRWRDEEEMEEEMKRSEEEIRDDSKKEMKR